MRQKSSIKKINTEILVFLKIPSQLYNVHIYTLQFTFPNNAKCWDLLALEGYFHNPH